MLRRPHARHRGLRARARAQSAPDAGGPRSGSIRHEALTVATEVTPWRRWSTAGHYGARMQRIGASQIAQDRRACRRQRGRSQPGSGLRQLARAQGLAACRSRIGLHRAQIPIEPAAPTPTDFPRLRALALLRRRPLECVESHALASVREPCTKPTGSGVECRAEKQTTLSCAPKVLSG